VTVPVRVLAVDDSPFFLDVLRGIVGAEPGLLLAGSACDGRDAVEKVLELRPDVVTMDIEMPVLDGLSALARIMKVRPTPVIMVSSHTRQASVATIQALSLGACDFVTKPDALQGAGLAGLRAELVEKLLAVGRGFAERPPAASSRGPVPDRKARIVVIGASTGGTTVLTRVVNGLPAGMGATVVLVQHMPELYTREFAKRLSESARCPVEEAKDGRLIEPGHVFVAPGGFHLSVYGNTFLVRKGEQVNGYRPSVDVTMQSVSRRFRPAVCGVLLTGIGRDGARGIEEIKDGGGFTVAQDEATSIVFGMPKAAIATGKVDFVLSDSEISSAMATIVGR
jgi:two-component system, chemotaxis family, protein-glutamate methylesterase/glutaminase